MDVSRYRPSQRARVSSTRALDDGDDFEGVEMEPHTSSKRPKQPQGGSGGSGGSAFYPFSGTACEIEDPRSRQRLTGRNASRFYAAKRVERDQEQEKLRQEANTPKAVEATLKAERARRATRRSAVSRLPNPISATRRFLSDPVTRFWLGCNLCTVVMLFVGSVLFMTLLYPVLLRPTLMY